MVLSSSGVSFLGVEKWVVVEVEGDTPAKKAGLNVIKGKNKWMELLKTAMQG